MMDIMDMIPEENIKKVEEILFNAINPLKRTIQCQIAIMQEVERYNSIIFNKAINNIRNSGEYEDVINSMFVINKDTGEMK